MFKLKTRNEENLNKLTSALRNLKEEIDVLVELEVGVNELESPRAMDVVLTTVFNSQDDLKIYQEHPNHLPVLSLAGDLCEYSKVVDYNC